ncbi:MAG: flagellar motor switch protein FliG [Deltaproteobacteria bacterium]|mgnify:CR=1 FL=1|nr:MAG: flagellar motor switch protein FliG [Deltaproteobacteria bacterium]
MVPKSAKELSGPQKAAILLLYLGEEVAGEVMRHLRESEIKKVVPLMAELDQVPREVVEEVVEEFLTFYEKKDEVVTGGREYLERVLSKALGAEKTRYILEMLRSEEEEPFSYLHRVDSSTLANYLCTEHPQTIAVVLSYLEREKAAEVLSELPEALQPEVVHRIANLSRVDPEVIEDMEEVLKQEIKVSKSSPVIGAKKGRKVAAEILNQLGGQAEQILSRLGEKDPEVTEEIKEAMFVFEDLVNADDRGLQKLLRGVSKEDLALALRMASDELKEKIFKNLSERAGQMLQEDMEAMGPVRVKDVEEAQRKIMAVARQLESKGELVIIGKGQEDVVF